MNLHHNQVEIKLVCTRYMDYFSFSKLSQRITEDSDMCATVVTKGLVN